MDTSWIKIYETGTPYKAEMIKGLLEENDIDAVIINKKDSAYLFGELEVFVQVDQVLKAKRILTTHREK